MASTFCDLCTFCDQVMGDGVGCSFGEYPDVPGPRLPWMDEHACHDCAVRAGQLHHPGCCVERCPQCRGQAIACPCVPDDDRDGGQ
jgi:hypothetical protein